MNLKISASRTFLKKEIFAVSLFIIAWCFVLCGFGYIFIAIGCYDGLLPLTRHELLGCWVAFMATSCLLICGMFKFFAGKIPVNQYELCLESVSYNKKNDVRLRFYFLRKGKPVNRKTRLQLAYTFGVRGSQGARERAFHGTYYALISYEQGDGKTVCRVEQRFEHPIHEYSAFVIQAYPRELVGHSLYFVIPAKYMAKIASLEEAYF